MKFLKPLGWAFLAVGAAIALIMFPFLAICGVLISRIRIKIAGLSLSEKEKELLKQLGMSHPHLAYELLDATEPAWGTLSSSLERESYRLRMEIRSNMPTTEEYRKLCEQAGISNWRIAIVS